MSVNLTDYPLFDTSVVTPDQALLDELAASYEATLGGAAREMERFLFGTVPVEVFDRIFAGAGEAAGNNADTGPLLWLMHLSGYFGGRWLRGEIVTAQPEAVIAQVSIPPTSAGFASTLEHTKAALEACRARDDADVVAYARSSLFDEPAPDGTEPVRGLTDNFGYNLGYLLEILASPPEGLNAGPGFQIESDGLFGCSYASPRLAVLPTLFDVRAAISVGQPPYESLFAELLPIQDAGVLRGRAVWSSGLSVQGFSQRSYDQLLDVSSSFLETVQATALTMARAVVSRDAAQARRGALANAAMVVWLAAYRDGLLDGAGPIGLPTFTNG